jgi:hypothetical protein
MPSDFPIERCEGWGPILGRISSLGQGFFKLERIEVLLNTKHHGTFKHSLLSRSPPAQGGQSPLPSLMRSCARWWPTVLETMYEITKAWAWRPPQVDVRQRLVVMDASEDRNQPVVLINPEITWASEEARERRRRLFVCARYLRWR